MPERISIVNPFFTPVLTGGAVKEFVYTRISIIQSDKRRIFKEERAVYTEGTPVYQSANKNPADSTLEEGMQKVIKWDKERQMLLAGNPVERRKER